MEQAKPFVQRLDDKSRMSGDVHVRFCERCALEGRFLRATRLVCAFELEADAERFYSVLGDRLGKFGLEVAAEKTNLIRFSPVNWKASGAFEFLGFEFRWRLGRRCKPVLKRRTARKKYRAALANLQGWCRKNCRLPKQILFAKLNSKLRGYYNYYGIRGNYDSLKDFFHQGKRILFKVLNRRSQRRSYNWKGFAELIKVFKLLCMANYRLSAEFEHLASLVPEGNLPYSTLP